MNRRLRLLWMLLAFCAQAAYPARALEVTGKELAQQVRSQMRSDGFEMRMLINTGNTNTNTNSNSNSESRELKLSLIGQFLPDGARLLARGIAPEQIHDHFVYAQMDESGNIATATYSSASAPGTPQLTSSRQAQPEGLYGSNVFIDDFFLAWLTWPGQEIVGSAEVAGTSCTLVRSTGAPNGITRGEVISCIDTAHSVVLRSEISPANGSPGRTITATALVSGQTGRLVAKSVLIASGDAESRVTVYSGDEEYAIRSGTFPDFNKER